MVEALIFWALALYGATLVVYQSVVAILHRAKPRREIVYFVVTHNSEENVEGILRNLVLRALFETNRRRVIVVDMNSNDDTNAIVMKMTQRYPFVEYVSAENEEVMMRILQSACMSQEAVGCLYDLRSDYYPYKSRM